MLEPEKNTDDLLKELEELRMQLAESNSIIEAIRDGAVDALVLNKEGQHTIYSLETADYTYRLLIERFSEGAVTLSESGLILYCNDYFAKLIYSSADKVIGTYFHSYIESVGEFQELKTKLNGASTKGEIILNINEKKIPVCVSLTDLNPLVPAISLIITDLTEKKKSEKELAMYQRKLELKISELNETNAHLVQFIHVISHDIKEPLRKIVSYSRHLHDTKHDLFKEEEIKNLNVISNSALRLNSLVDDLAKYSLHTSKTELEELDLNVILKEVIDDMEMSVRETGTKFTINELPEITASGFQIRQLFLNLISNSIKYAKPGVPPYITISAEVCDCVDVHNPNRKFYRISFLDNGIGIEHQHIDKIFTMFQRLHPAGAYSGNGVGLAICKKIMENHYGKIEVESTINAGTIFNVYFPVKK